MGIRGLNSLIKKICPECIMSNNIKDYNGKTFIIDASIFMYKFRHMASSNNTLQHSAHIIGFINRIKYYKINGINPIFVFDGKPPVEKKNTLIKRYENKLKIQDRINLLNNIETDDLEQKNEIGKEIKKLSNQIIYVTKNHLDECKKLFDLLNITYYNAPDEAEKYCVYLYNNGYGDYIVSDDTDVFTFGGTKVIKSSIKNNNIIETDINLFLNKIGYDNKKFIDLCILSGCDYLPFIPSLAINTVYNLLKKYDSIEQIIELNKYKFPSEYDYIKIRKIFTEFDYEKPIINLNIININKLELKNYLESFNIKNTIKIINNF